MYKEWGKCVTCVVDFGKDEMHSWQQAQIKQKWQARQRERISAKWHGTSPASNGDKQTTCSVAWTILRKVGHVRCHVQGRRNRFTTIIYSSKCSMLNGKVDDEEEDFPDWREDKTSQHTSIRCTPPNMTHSVTMPLHVVILRSWPACLVVSPPSCYYSKVGFKTSTNSRKCDFFLC